MSLIPTVLKPFRFFEMADLDQAHRALWCDIPTSILITGPAASGKTRLARAIAKSNRLDPLFVHNSGRSLNPAFRNATCVILDNQKKFHFGGWPFPQKLNDPPRGYFEDRKTGSKRGRQFMWSGLLITTARDFEDPLHSFDLTIRLVPKTRLSLLLARVKGIE